MNKLAFVSEIVKSGGLRKLSLAFYCFTLLSILMFFSKIDTATFTSVSMYLIIGVFGANSFEHYTKAKQPNSPEITTNGQS